MPLDFPIHERVLFGYLGELGARMTRHRFQLARLHVGQIAANVMRSAPLKTIAVVAAAFGLGLLIGGGGKRCVDG